ncbi:MAG TPA: DUF1697 domain-containing protein [Flavobacterium sp.]|jgi:uncharacterized protein (DUF1697 family)
MKTHLALLRGINVSGQKLIKMEDLRKLLENEGFENVRTYIQSGNVIFDNASSAKEELAQQISGAIKRQYGFEVTVVMADKRLLKRTVVENPFLENAESKQLYVAFLSEIPAAENIEKMSQAAIAPDEAIIIDDVMYLKYAVGAGQSKLTNSLIENRLKVKATSRNWNTTLKLLELLNERK